MFRFQYLYLYSYLRLEYSYLYLYLRPEYLLPYAMCSLRMDGYPIRPSGSGRLSTIW